jgi:hypothetical protein
VASVPWASCDDDKKNNKGQWHVRILSRKGKQKNNDDLFCAFVVVLFYSL